MPADANIFQQYLQQPKSVLDYQNQYNDADTKRNALQQSVLALQKGQMDMANAADVSRQRNALRDAITSGQIDLSNPDHAPRALALAPDVAPAMLKTVQEGATSRAKAGLDTAQAGHATAQTDAETFKTRVAKSDQAIKDISGFQNPQQALASLEQHASAGDIPQEQAQIIRQQLATMNPADFPKWQLGMVQNIMTAKDRMEYMAPNANTVANNQTQITTTGMNNATSVKTTGMNNATSVKTTGMNNATSTANNRANIAKDYAVNGLNPDGTPNTGNQGAMVDMLGNYQLNPTLALQRLPAGQRAALVAQVQAKYPGWDETQYDAKKGAAAKFTSGDLGNALRSVSTANAHLDQLGELADAMGNGNTQVVNRVGNYFATQMGDPKVTNFDAIKAIVGQEVVKAIVAGGGTGGERDEATHAFDSAKSPQQLKGVIQHYRAVMAAQQSNLLAQRDAAGLPRSTLPNYNGASGATGAPPGWGIQRVK